jgi:hypothetical protein
MTDDSRAKAPNFAKMSDAEYREHTAAQKRSSSTNLGSATSSASQTSMQSATKYSLRELGLEGRNTAWAVLTFVLIVAALSGIVMLISGASGLNVQSDLPGVPTTNPGLPWLIVGGGLLNLAVLTGISMLVVAAVRWKAHE